MTINQDMKALIAARTLAPDFLFWTLVGLKHPLVALADESAHGTRKVETDLLRGFRIGLPPYSEQKLICDYLEQETAQISHLMNEIAEAIERLREYRSALITAAVTGKIDVRESADTMAPVK